MHSIKIRSGKYFFRGVSKFRFFVIFELRFGGPAGQNRLILSDFLKIFQEISRKRKKKLRPKLLREVEIPFRDWPKIHGIVVLRQMALI